jgi:hypothetical protein
LLTNWLYQRLALVACCAYGAAGTGRAVPSAKPPPTAERVDQRSPIPLIWLLAKRLDQSFRPIGSHALPGFTLNQEMPLPPARLIEAHLNLDAATIAALRKDTPIIVK